MNALGFFLSCTLAFLLTPVVLILLERFQILDQPTLERKIHLRPMPVGGGLAIYLAFFAFQLGLEILVNSLWLVATLIPTVAIIAVVVVPREERYLTGRFGAEYLDYKASVRRWL